MRFLLMAAVIALSLPVHAQEFERDLLSGLWAVNSSTRPACTPDSLHARHELSADGKVLLFMLDRKWKLNSGKTVDQYSATVLRSTTRSLFIKYNDDAGEHRADYPKEWEMAFVAPGVYRWRATDWPEGRVNPVVGIRCSP
jgi:hypothetical protein